MLSLKQDRRLWSHLNKIQRDLYSVLEAVYTGVLSRVVFFQGYGQYRQASCWYVDACQNLESLIQWQSCPSRNAEHRPNPGCPGKSNVALKTCWGKVLFWKKENELDRGDEGFDEKIKATTKISHTHIQSGMQTISVMKHRQTMNSQTPYIIER